MQLVHATRGFRLAVIMITADEWLVFGGRIIDPAAGIDRVGWLHVRDGRIAAVGHDDPPPIAPRIDATGWLVAPGLIDPHVHFRDPGQTHKEDLASGSAAAAAGGFTTVACMPNTDPALDSGEVVRDVSTRARAIGLCRVHVVAAATIGRRGETPVDFAALESAGAIAFSDDGDGVEDDAVCGQILRGVAAVDAVFYPHCEFKALSRRGVVHLGPVSERLGVTGYDPRGEEAMIERDLALVAEIGARYHVAHVSTARGVELIRAAKDRGLPVTTEVCPHHLLLCDEDVIAVDPAGDTDCKMSPPLRSRADVAALVAAVRDGTIDCVVTDHAPHAASEKALPFAEAPMGIVGLETALGCAAKALLGSFGFDWPELIERMSTAPARIFGLAGGSLAVGSPADLCVIDPAASWNVDPSNFRSKSRNTPFGGWELPARAVWTVLGGRTTHADPGVAARISPARPG
jgi:dihydroorotase